MEITLEKKAPTNATIKVNLKEADYQPKVSQKLKEYSKKANIKGFRPGKVPTSLIERMYGKSILVDEINHILSHSVTDYIKENKLPIIGDPLPETSETESIDWETQKDFEFSYEVGLVPTFQYDLSENVKVTKYSIDIEDKVVNETLENLKNQYGKMENPETSEANDFLYGEFKEVNGEFTANGVLPLNKVKDAESKKIIGLKKEETVKLDITNLFDDEAVLAHTLNISVDEAKNKKGEFEFTVKNINRTEPAELNKEFFDKIFGNDAVQSEEEFFKKLRETIAENYNRESDNLLLFKIQEQLIKNTAIDLPNEFLKRWLLISNEGKVTQEQIDKEYDYYVKELKWTLIKNKIAEDNSIKVENEEVESKAKELIQMQFGGLSFDNEEMQETLNKIIENYLKQDKGKNYVKTYEQVLFDKVISVIKEKVNIEEKNVSVDEFKELAKA